jgi:nucleoside-diphosphate-sugar epimerase
MNVDTPTLLNLEDFIMKVFVTGATGFVGSAVVKELMAAGHRVRGLARSDAAAEALTAAGVEVHRGSIDDLDSLRSGVVGTDGVIHTAFNHDFSTYVANCEADRRIVGTLGASLAGSGRPMVVTTGMTLLATGRLGTEEDAAFSSAAGVPRSASEEAAVLLVPQNVRAVVMRLPQVHDPLKQGLITYMIALAREKRVSAYIGEGLNRWPAVHVLDAANLYRLALEKGISGSRYHAIGEQGVSLREIAECIGRGLNLPVVTKSSDEATEHFGWLESFVSMDSPASSELTQKWLGWRPVQPTLIADLALARYA